MRLICWHLSALFQFATEYGDRVAERSAGCQPQEIRCSAQVPRRVDRAPGKRPYSHVHDGQQGELQVVRLPEIISRHDAKPSLHASTARITGVGGVTVEEELVDPGEAFGRDLGRHLSYQKQSLIGTLSSRARYRSQRPSRSSTWMPTSFSVHLDVWPKRGAMRATCPTTGTMAYLLSTEL